MALGTVKWFSEEKGFGFVTPDGGGKDCFAHHSEIQMSGKRNLVQGQRVEYTPIEDKKGPKATKIFIK